MLNKLKDSFLNYHRLIKINFSNNEEEIKKLMKNTNLYILNSNLSHSKNTLFQKIFINKAFKSDLDNDFSKHFALIRYCGLINLITNKNLTQDNFDFLIEKLSNSELINNLEDNKSFIYVLIDILDEISKSKYIDGSNLENLYKIYNQEVYDIVLDKINKSSFKDNLDKDKLLNIEEVVKNIENNYSHIFERKF